MNILGIDIGGTSIKADVYDEDGTALGHFSEQSTKICHENQTNEILEQICDLIASYQSSLDLDGVAISTAGVVDSQSGKIVYAGYTIPSYSGTDFSSEIQKRFSIPVTVENDVNCALLGEMWKGAARNSHSTVMITVGTGIGGGIFTNEQILSGHNFTAGEIGYLPIGNADWQSLASASALVQMYEEASGLHHQTGKTFFEAVDKGDPVALKVLETYIHHLAQGLVTLSYVLNPEKMILGGGIFARSDVLLPLLQNELYHAVQDQRFLPREIVTATLGNEAGRLGAVAKFLMDQGKNLS